VAGKPIEIQIDAETRGAEDGIEKVADKLDDVVDASKAVGKAGDNAGEKIEDAARDAAKVIDRDLTEALKEAAKVSRTAGDEIGSRVKKGAEDADEGVRALKENTAANAKEIGASFSDVESVIGGIQGLAAEALEGFGPAGLAAGVAGAAGIGLITNALQTADEKAQALHDDAVDLASSLRDAGDDGAAIAAILGSRFEEFGAKVVSGGSKISQIFGAETATNVDLIVDLLKSGVLSAHDLDQAFRGLTAEDRLIGLKNVLSKATKESDRLNSSGKSLTVAQEAQYVATSKVADSIKDQIAVEEQANALNKALADSMHLTVEEYEKRAKAAEAAAEKEKAAVDAAAAVQDSYASALQGSGDAVTVYQENLDRKNAAEQKAAEATAAATKDTKDSWEDYAQAVTVSTDDLIADWNRQAEEARTFQTNLATIAAAGGQALADELRAKGPEVAGAVASVIAQAGPDKQREAIAAHANATGAEVGRGIALGIGTQQQVFADAVRGFVAGVPVPSLNVKVQADTEQFKRTIRELTDGAIVVTVNGKAGRPVY
jgi:hypothetical protein